MACGPLADGFLAQARERAKITAQVAPVVQTTNPDIEVDSERSAKGTELSRGVNSERFENFILSSLYRSKYWAMLGDVGACSAHAVVGHQAHPFVLHATPQPLNKHVVPLGSLAIQRELTALLENGHGEFLRRELVTLRSAPCDWQHSNPL